MKLGRMFVFFQLALLWVVSAASAFETGSVNPLFERYMQQFTIPESGETAFSSSAYGHPDGLIPSPLYPETHAFEMLPSELNFSADGSPPADFDWRDPDGDGDFADSIVTPVRNQGDCGSCWAFAAYGTLEANLNMAQVLDEVSNDYSENHLIHTHGFDWGICEGGNMDMSMAYLARYSGPVWEGDDPYNPADLLSYCETCRPQFYVDQMVYLPGRNTIEDNLYIKQALQSFGPLYTTMYMDETLYYDETAKTYLNTDFYFDPEDLDNSEDTNHAVVIVGWDDGLAVAGAENTGAFIVKNSYGAGWGDAGYFYISYEDESLARYSLGYFLDEDDSQLPFDKIYQYDPLGMNKPIYYTDSNIFYAANVFDVEEDGWLRAVGLFVYDSNSSCDIQVFRGVQVDGVNAQFSDLVATGQTLPLGRGYHTIKLEAPVNIAGGDTMAIQIKYSLPSGTVHCPIEHDQPYINTSYSSQADAGPGQSYYSSNGLLFTDLTSVTGFEKSNMCIKALVKTESTIEVDPSLTLFSTTASQQLVAGYIHQATGLQTVSWHNLKTGEEGNFLLGSYSGPSSELNDITIPFQDQIALGHYGNTIEMAAIDNLGLEIGRNTITITRLPLGYETIEVPIITTVEVPVYEQIPIYKTVTVYCYIWDPVLMYLKKRACGIQVVIDHYETVLSHYETMEVIDGYETIQVEIWE